MICLTCFLVLADSAVPNISLEAAKALDTDGSGKVELNEIVTFARSHGLDVAAVRDEFTSFDKNQDGTLDISELNATLGVPDVKTAEKVTLRTRSQPTASINQATVPSPPQAMIKVHDQPAAQASATVTAAPASAVVTAAPISADATAAMSMIKALDTDGSGVVEKSEVDAFALSQGLSAAETAEEFKDLDKNHDGQLDPAEISSTVSQYTNAPTAASVPTAAPVIAAASPAPTAPPASVPVVATAAPAPAKKTLTETAPAAETGLPPMDNSVPPADSAEVTKTLLQNTAQADRTVAQLFALKASDDLARRDKDLQEASVLEQKAKSLREQAAKVSSQAIEESELSAQKVGREIMEKALEEAQTLENEAKKVESRAASINAKAKIAMSQAIKAQTSASKAVEDLVTAAANVKIF